MQVWTLAVAALAVLATVVAAILLRKTGKRTVDAAKQAAAASERNAEAAERSADAAQAAVGVNRETAAGVAVRAEADSLALRYQDAAAQLGHENAAIRLAGVYAMARLADDWEPQRQTCIDVLCAYLRMPWLTNGEITDTREREVRRAILTSIGSRLVRDGERVSWWDLRFELTDADLPGFWFAEGELKVRADFSRSRFLERSGFGNLVFHNGT